MAVSFVSLYLYRGDCASDLGDKTILEAVASIGMPLSTGGASAKWVPTVWAPLNSVMCSNRRPLRGR